MDIHSLEKQVMTGDRRAILILVSLFREYRAACEELLEKNARGGCDQASMFHFEETLLEAMENAINED